MVCPCGQGHPARDWQPQPVCGGAGCASVYEVRRDTCRPVSLAFFARVFSVDGHGASESGRGAGGVDAVPGAGVWTTADE
jgi:hypothetical protein